MQRMVMPGSGDQGEASLSIGWDPINGTIYASPLNGSLYRFDCGMSERAGYEEIR